MASTALYNAIIWELRKRIFARGLTMQDCDDLSGNQDGYTAKMLHPDTKQGRQAQWESIENLVQALYKEGYRLQIRPLKQTMPNGFGTIEKSRKNGVAGKLPIRDYAAFAGRKSWESRRRDPEQWRAHCRKAAKARWLKHRKARRASRRAVGRASGTPPATAPRSRGP